jgi:hypothetical protein
VVGHATTPPQWAGLVFSPLSFYWNIVMGLKMNKTFLTLAEKVKVINWLNNNAERVKPMSATKAAEVCSGEIGVKANANHLSNIARSCEMDLFTQSTVVRVPKIQDVGSWHNVAAVLARNAEKVNKELGIITGEEANLQHIIHRYHKKVALPN